MLLGLGDRPAQTRGVRPWRYWRGNEGAGEESDSFRLVRISWSPLLLLTLAPLTISPTQGSLLNFPRTKALQSGRCMWQMGRGGTQPERWRKQFSAPSPTSYRNSPSGLLTPEASPTLSLTLSPGLPLKQAGRRRDPLPSALPHGRLVPRPPGSVPVAPPPLSPQSPGQTLVHKRPRL